MRDDDPDDVDYPYYITAHEIAHQWWAHQVVGANVQGATMIVETLAQYSALMVMKRKVGEAGMRRFLRYELDRYLIGRSAERKKELPLARVENQPYIHYQKGSLAMYALQDYIGEDSGQPRAPRVPRRVGVQGAAVPDDARIPEHLRAVTPPELAGTVDDLFETITLYDNRATAASAKALPDGRYEVSVDVFAKKRRADEIGRETDVPLDDWIDVGVLDEDGNALVVEKRRIRARDATYTFVVDAQPARAGIDPFNKLIDRRPKDNTVPVTCALTRPAGSGAARALRLARPVGRPAEPAREVRGRRVGVVNLVEHHRAQGEPPAVGPPEQRQQARCSARRPRRAGRTAARRATFPRATPSVASRNVQATATRRCSTHESLSESGIRWSASRRAQGHARCTTSARTMSAKCHAFRWRAWSSGSRRIVNPRLRSRTPSSTSSIDGCL